MLSGTMPDGADRPSKLHNVSLKTKLLLMMVSLLLLSVSSLFLLHLYSEQRLISQLREVGIRGRLQTMERGIFLQRLQGGLKDWPGVQIILHGARIGGSWSFWYEGHFKCGGFNSRDRICVKDLDGKFDQYERSINPAERKKLAEEIQRGILENYYLVPVFRHAFVNAIGPRVALQKWQDVFPTITTGYAYPWEEIKVKDQ